MNQWKNIANNKKELFSLQYLGNYLDTDCSCCSSIETYEGSDEIIQDTRAQHLERKPLLDNASSRESFQRVGLINTSIPEAMLESGKNIKSKQNTNYITKSNDVCLPPIKQIRWADNLVCVYSYSPPKSYMLWKTLRKMIVRTVEVLKHDIEF